MLAHKVIVIGFVQLRNHQHGFVHQLGQVGERVPEQAADAGRHIDAGPFQFVEGNYFQIGNPQTAFLPDGFDAQQVQELGDVLAAAPHVGAGPEDHTDVLGILSFVGNVLFNHAVAQFFPGHPACLGGQCAGIHTVEVTTGRQQIYAAGAGRSGRPGGHIFAGEGCQRMIQFICCSGKTGIYFFNDILSKGFNFLLPFFRPFCRFRQLHGRVDRLFRETLFRNGRYKCPAFVADAAQQFAAGQVEGFHDSGGILFQFLKIQTEFFCPQVI